MIVWRSWGAWVLVLLPLPAWALESPSFLADKVSPETTVQTSQESSSGEDLLKEAALGGHARFDYYSASKKLDNNHSLAGLTFQPRARPKFGTWGDAKIEARIQDEDLSDRGKSKPSGRLLESYANIYFGSIDLRIGKQIIAWGRADALNPTDNLTPKDFTLLSAKDEDERRIGSSGVKINYYQGSYTLSLIWLPIFNPSTIPLTPPPPGFRLTEEKRDNGTWTDQGFAAKLDQTGGAVDWSVSYYYGLDVMPSVRSLSPTETLLVHNRLHVFGADFAKVIGRYNIRGETAYTHTQDPRGTDPVIKNPYYQYVLGADRDFGEGLNVNLQFFQRIIVNFHDPAEIQNPLARTTALFNAILTQQQDEVQEGLTGRIRQTWLNETLEGQLTGVWNANRNDFFLRPMLSYAFTDVWKGFAGADIYNGPTASPFGRLRPTTALFMEIRATL